MSKTQWTVLTACGNGMCKRTFISQLFSGKSSTKHELVGGHGLDVIALFPARQDMLDLNRSYYANAE
jgi:hypothetical protein